MMTKAAMMVAALGMFGCADREPAPLNEAIAGPPAADVERAMSASWDPTMQATTRPRISWVDNSGCGLARTVAAATMQAAPRCDDVAFDSAGAVTVGWHKGERISDTGLGLGLAQWKAWLWTSSVQDHELIDSERVWFDAQILAAGL